ncbi:hypothetical protein L1987_01497 [Smallanthus sonchifolius]|uniref:Uncharacterized protein n=1 Tax=Smallanthus sonchifolius TaxID=185202 RepID=A0ACB9K598_9ASTR|nr:hypothetical protein L1987_01497 [Smallanthus sonchifolius]
MAERVFSFKRLANGQRRQSKGVTGHNTRFFHWFEHTKFVNSICSSTGLSLLYNMRHLYSCVVDFCSRTPSARAALASHMDVDKLREGTSKSNAEVNFRLRLDCVSGNSRTKVEEDGLAAKIRHGENNFVLLH